MADNLSVSLSFAAALEPEPVVVVRNLPRLDRRRETVMDQRGIAAVPRTPTRAEGNDRVPARRRSRIFLPVLILAAILSVGRLRVDVRDSTFVLPMGFRGVFRVEYEEPGFGLLGPMVMSTVRASAAGATDGAASNPFGPRCRGRVSFVDTQGRRFPHEREQGDTSAVKVWGPFAFHPDHDKPYRSLTMWDTRTVALYLVGRAVDARAWRYDPFMFGTGRQVLRHGATGAVLFTPTEATLSAQRIEGRRLDGATLPRASLIETSFNRSSLRAAEFPESVLEECSFEASDLTDAVFEGTQLTGINFRRAILRNASFRGATITNCDFRGADCTGSDLPLAYRGK